MVGPDWAGGGRQERGHLPHGGVGGGESTVAAWGQFRAGGVGVVT